MWLKVVISFILNDHNLLCKNTLFTCFKSNIRFVQNFHCNILAQVALYYYQYIHHISLNKLVHHSVVKAFTVFIMEFS